MMFFYGKEKLSKAYYKNKENFSNLEEIIDFSQIPNREIFIDNFTPQVASKIDTLIRFWNKIDEENELPFSERQAIKIYLNSHGGDLDSMFTIMNSIKLSGTPVYTINIGTVYNEALFVYLSGHIRYAYPNSSFLFSLDIKSFEDNPQESTFYNYKTFYENRIETLKSILLEKTKITENQFNKHYKNGWWISADEGYKLHFCNEILRMHSSLKK